MKREVDARNQICPKPVIMTKKALDEVTDGIITIIVDNEVAKENVSKLAQSMNYSYTVDKNRGNEFYIHITKGESKEDSKEEVQATCIPNTFKDMVIVFGQDKLGNGSDELGKILMKGFIYTLTESTPFPSALLFLNGGVKLTIKGSEVIEDLKNLEAEGVEILSCGTCLDYYKIKDELMVGQITNMYTIVEKMENTTNTISL